MCQHWIEFQRLAKMLWKTSRSTLRYLHYYRPLYSHISRSYDLTYHFICILDHNSYLFYFILPVISAHQQQYTNSDTGIIRSGISDWSKIVFGNATLFHCYSEDQRGELMSRDAYVGTGIFTWISPATQLDNSEL